MSGGGGGGSDDGVSGRSEMDPDYVRENPGQALPWKGTSRLGGGRGNPASGRNEVYERRHSPMAPGPDGGQGGTEGRPSFSQAFKHHAMDKYTDSENMTRGLVSLLPGGGVVQGLMAGASALNDVFGSPESFNNMGNQDFPDQVDSGNDMVARQTVARAAAPKGSPGGASQPKSGVSPQGSVSTTVKDTSPAKSRSGTGRSRTNLTSPFGDLSQAPVTQKTLLGQ